MNISNLEWLDWISYNITISRGHWNAELSYHQFIKDIVYFIFNIIKNL